MKKTLFLLVIFMITSLGLKAQGATATLQSGEKLSVFYGPGALQEAYDAAIDGDIVTLSKGTFTPLSDSMKKSIKIIGTSAFEDNNTVIENMTISANNVQIDGIKFSSKLYATLADNLIIKHCYIETLTAGRINKKTLIDQSCIKLVEMMKFFVDFTFKNSTIGQFSSSNTNSEDNIGNITHCVIYRFNSGKDIKAIYRNNFFCIQEFMPKTIECAEPSEYYNNVAINLNMDLWVSLNFSTNCINTNNTVLSGTEIFEDGKEKYPSTTKNEPIGDDGTKVGIFGGSGFTAFPSIPSIIERYIDSATNEDGKIHVEIKAKINK